MDAISDEHTNPKATARDPSPTRGAHHRRGGEGGRRERPNATPMACRCAFSDALRQATTQAVDATVRRLAQLSGQAVDVLQDAMSDQDATTGAKLRAADIALGRLLSMRELHDFEQRITQLEAAQKAGRP